MHSAPLPLARVLIWYWGRRGGGAAYTLEMARALKARESFELHLSLSRQNELFEDFAALDLPGFHVDTVSGRLGPVTALLRVPQMRRRLSEYLLAQRIDGVYGTMSTIWSGLAAGVLRGLPYLHTVHDASPHPGERIPLPDRLVNRELAASSGLIVLSEHVRRQLQEARSYPDDLIWTVPLAGAPGMGGPRQAPRDRPWRLMFFGRILDYKGLGLLLDAYAALKTRYEVDLEIVGGGDLTPYRRQLEALPEVRVDNRWIPEGEIGAVISRADLIVLPYIEASQSAVVPLAYGAAIPVVATPVGGLAEQVGHEQTGALAENVSAEAVAAAIARLLADPDLYQGCSAGALALAKDELSWAKAAGKVAGAMGDVLNRGTVAGPSNL